MATERLQHPRDPIQLGKLMVDIATGQVVDAVEDGKDQRRQNWDGWAALRAVLLGRNL